jgi:STE24 endopeptidase
MFFQSALVGANALCAWEVYLLLRQHGAHRGADVPSELKQRLTAEDYAATQAYTREKLLFSMVDKFKDCAVLSAALLRGTLASLYETSYAVIASADAQRALRWAGRALTRFGKKDSVGAVGHGVEVRYGGIIHSWAYAILNDLISTAIDIPFLLYYHFIVEARHGFNRLTLCEFVKDQMKLLLLRSVVIHPLTCGVTHFVVNRFSTKFPLYLFVAGATTMLCGMFVVPALIMPLFNTYTPLPEDHTLSLKIRALASQVNFPLTKIYTMDGSRRTSHSNAFFYGFGGNKRIVIFDTLIHHTQCDEELVAVVAHEMGHWHHNHVAALLSTSMLHLALVCWGAKCFIFNDELYTQFGFRRGVRDPMVGLTLFVLCVWGNASLLLEYLTNLLSRRFELQADAFAVRLGLGEHLKKGLVAISKENKASVTPDWMFAALHYTHPTLPERLRHIDAAMRKYSSGNDNTGVKGQ